MALISCKECGKQVSDQAVSCPHCGAPLKPAVTTPPRKSNPGCGTLIVAVICLLIVISAIRACSDRGASTSPGSKPTATAVTPEQKAREQAAQLQVWKETALNQNYSAVGRVAAAKSIVETAPDSPEAAEVKPLIPDLQKAADELADLGSWDYFSSQDPMSDKPVHTARVQSENPFEFDFPYAGPQHASLTIRRHPKWGKDVIFAIERGQVLCSSYSCPVRVRFDDEPAKTYVGNGPADNSTESVFIPAYSTFMAKLGKAKRVRIEVNVYKQGTVTAEFKTKGFDKARL